jgi:hypothetical protein
MGVAAAQTNISMYVKSTGKLAVYYNGANAFYDGTGTNTLTSGIWYHLSAIFPNGVAPTGYVNGNLDGTGNAIFTQNGHSVTQSGTDATNWFGGVLADVAIWPVALSQAELSALSKGARPNTIRPPSLIGWWPLDGIQSPEPDLSGNVNNGTLTGTTFAAGPPIAQFTSRWPQYNFPPTAPTFQAAWAMGKNIVVEGVAT